MRWEEAVAEGVQSPHRDPERFREAADWMRQQAVAEHLQALIDQERLPEAQRTVLALGHFEAYLDGTDATSLFAEYRLRERFWRQLGEPRSRLLRVCLAAARCAVALDELKGSSPALLELRREVWKVCFGLSLFHALHLEQVIRDHDVLIVGETGTGKELVARAIQAGTLGDQAGAPAPAGAINAAAVPETLLESELFGHTKGAFTGATENRIGGVRSAHGGSFFLDEVGDLRQSTQVALLRVIETDEVRPLGSDKTYRADVRYVAATHNDLGAQVEAGTFRQDLFQRLAGNILRVPPLRERPEDIVGIGRAFVARHVPERTAAVDHSRLEAWLLSNVRSGQSWPGNVRQLQNALRDLLLGLPTLTPTETASESTRATASLPGHALPEAIARGTASLETVNRWYLELVLSNNGDNASQAARVLGVDRTTVYRWLKQPTETA